MSDPRQKDFDERHTRLPTVTALTKREYYSIMALQGLLYHSGVLRTEQEYVKLSIKIADELIKQLADGRPR